MSFPALRTQTQASRTEFTSTSKADDTKTDASRPTRSDARTDIHRAVTRPTLPVVLEPHWEMSIDCATD